MQNYVVNLKSNVSKSYFCQKAADSLDIDTKKKSEHNLSINADLKTKFNIGLIVGSSGSGKTTLSKQIFGDDCFNEILDNSKPVIEQFPKDFNYDQRAKALSGIGLTSVPCWIRPAYTLSNGQKARAEAVLQMSTKENDIILDEWTSVVDRNVAKIMSHSIQKHSRKNDKQIILCSCHYDVIEWLNPDWIIDCNKQTYTNRRSMVGTFERTDQLRLEIKECGRSSWKYFSKYHYLSDKLPGGKLYFYGLYDGENQIGFQCFASYVPGKTKMYHSNRTVIHPDYVGFGLGIKLINETSKIMFAKKLDIRAKFSSIPIFKLMNKDENWKLIGIDKKMKIDSASLKVNKKFGRSGRDNKSTFRNKTVSYNFKFIGTKATT